MCNITHSDAFLALQAELQEERTWREQLADLSIDQQQEIERLRAIIVDYDERHTRLLENIERWNATIAVGRAKAEQMEAVIQAARGVINCLDFKPNDQVWDHASGGACLNLLDEALAEYDSNAVPLPAAFNQS